MSRLLIALLALTLTVLSGCSSVSQQEVNQALDSPEAAYTLGNRLYARGEVDAGLKWIKRAADENYTRAQYTLGLLYASDRYSQGGIVEAEHYLREASESGMHNASYKLAEYYRTGVIGEPDVTKAVLFYERAIDQGSMDARKALGVMYLKGIGVKQDNAKAKKLLSVFN